MFFLECSRMILDPQNMLGSLHFESWNFCAASLFNLNSDPSIIIIIVIVIIGNQYQTVIMIMAMDQVKCPFPQIRTLPIW